MSKLTISLSVGNYDRTAAIFDGRAPIEGCEVRAVHLEPEEAFHRAFRYEEFDVTEISMSSHMMTTARPVIAAIGTDPVTPVPGPEPSVGPSCMRESPEWPRLSPMTQTRSGGTVMSKWMRLGASPAATYVSVIGVPVESQATKVTSTSGGGGGN